MKIGIITAYDSSNYGAFLQGYATQIFLKDLGHDVYFIKWRSDEKRKRLFMGESRSIKSLLRYVLNYSHNKEKYRCMTNDVEKLNIIPVEAIEQQKLDAVVIGSDELWNINIMNFQNCYFYGVGLPANLCKLVYAVSLGGAKTEDFMKFPSFIEGMKKLKIVGVRDINTQKVTEDLVGIKPSIVCDPTCLITPDNFDIPSERVIKEDYLLVYTYGVDKSLQKYLIRFAKEKKLKLVAVCMRQRWCDININSTPLQFYNIIRYASYVFTTTFHGSIFTLMQHKKCAVYARSEKVKDLLKWMCMEDIKVELSYTYKEFCDILEKEHDYSGYEKAVNTRREQSIALFKSELKEVKDGSDL